jgi:hypothetical protein
MADSTTTGSALAGLNDGMMGGCYPSGTFCGIIPKLYYCIYDPLNVVTHHNGSDIAWACATGSFFIAEGNATGSEWHALRTV